LSENEPINLLNAETAINELLDVSRMLNNLGVKYDTQKPILDLAEKIYVEEYLPEALNEDD